MPTQATNGCPGRGEGVPAGGADRFDLDGRDPRRDRPVHRGTGVVEDDGSFGLERECRLGRYQGIPLNSRATVSVAVKGCLARG